MNHFERLALRALLIILKRHGDDDEAQCLVIEIKAALRCM